MKAFLELLPHDTDAARTIARRRSAAFMKGRTRLATGESRALRHAVEIRHESFLDPSFVELLREHNVALVIAETARRWAMAQDVTADFVYMRLHGDKSFTAAAIRMQRSRAGRAAFAPGTVARSPLTRIRYRSRKRQRPKHAMCIVFSTIPTLSCVRRAMRKPSCASLA